MADIASSVPLSGKSWFITGLGVAQIASWGSLYYSFPLVAKAMEADLGWNKALIYGAATAGALLSALLAIPVGQAIDRGHGRIVMTVSSVIASALLILWALTDNVVLFYAAAGGVGALQAATLYEPAFAVVARRAGPSGARDGITALTLWGGFASTVFVPLVQWLMDQFGWRGALEVLAAVNLVLCASIYWLVIDPARDATVTEAAGSNASRSYLREALVNPTFWWLAVSFTAYAATFSTLLLHFYPMMIERGFSEHAVVAAMSLIGPAQVAGRIAIMALGRQASGKRIGSFVVIFFPIAMALFAWAPAEFVVVAATAVIYGAANGIMTILRGIAIPEMVSKEAYGSINGALVVPMNVSRAVAPLMAAALWTATGDYSGTMIAVLALSLLMVAAFWLAAASSGRSGPAKDR
ncbi:MFS transporter [Devosia rhizoryzae]|uniref:MFS transporter n=1 Tax=Devosia rhizoryzae TaxID=2774137 RepID=A0ABX7C753_9HYPH|nr:MFS transporter [Devosia rhizoryzae]QQR40095.1 MFS transporter [Devosia rhizoryzae]